MYMYMLYSWKLFQVKTFANFAVLPSSAKVLFANFSHTCTCTCTCSRPQPTVLIVNPRKFSPQNFRRFVKVSWLYSVCSILPLNYCIDICQLHMYMYMYMYTCMYCVIVLCTCMYMCTCSTLLWNGNSLVPRISPRARRVMVDLCTWLRLNFYTGAKVIQYIRMHQTRRAWGQG